MNFELCTATVEGVASAASLNFKRVELCSALEVGGLTPSLGLVQQATQFNVEIHCMIRHRSGQFQYSATDIAIMKKDIELMYQAGAKGVVFGVLTNSNTISDDNIALVTHARSFGLETTFHRAFDQVANPFRAIEKIIAIQFDRLLTSGQKPTAIEGIQLIQKLQHNYGHKIQLMAGSGVNATNALALAASGIDNLHFTAHTKESSVTNEMGWELKPNTQKMTEILSLFA